MGYTNFALSANAATASANQSDNPSGAASKTNDGVRVSGQVDYWYAANPSAGSPKTLIYDFGQPRTISEFDLISIRNDYTSAAPITASETSSYAAQTYTIDYWNGAIWVNAVTSSSNNHVLQQFFITPVTTTQVRLSITYSPDGYARVAEFEAWGASGMGDPSPILSKILRN